MCNQTLMLSVMVHGAPTQLGNDTMLSVMVIRTTAAYVAISHMALAVKLTRGCQRRGDLLQSALRRVTPAHDAFTCRATRRLLFRLPFSRGFDSFSPLHFWPPRGPLVYSQICSVMHACVALICLCRGECIVSNTGARRESRQMEHD